MKTVLIQTSSRSELMLREISRNRKDNGEVIRSKVDIVTKLIMDLYKKEIGDL